MTWTARSNLTGAVSRSRYEHALHCIPMTRDKRCRDLLIEVAKELGRRLGISEYDVSMAVSEAGYCPECFGDLGGHDIGRLEEHEPGCPRFPL